MTENTITGDELDQGLDASTTPLPPAEPARGRSAWGR
ncbi:hypothetical protein ABIE67_004451 [Streptomyces sp. V4I8]